MELVDSYYEATAERGAGFAPLDGALKARVAIIGGGYAGLNVALGLAERGYRDVVLLEAERVGFGASGRNGGFVFGGYARSEEKLVSELPGRRGVRMYRRTVEAIELIRERVRRYAIDCALNEGGVVWANWFRSDRVLQRKAEFMRDRFAIDWPFLNRDALAQYVRSARYSGGLLEGRGMHFHPLNYALGIAQAAQAQGVQIFERSPAIQISGKRSDFAVQTPNGVIRCDEVIVAAGGYQRGLFKPAERAALPIATFVVATEPLGEAIDDAIPGEAAIYDTRFAFDYYRKLADKRLLWGGRIAVGEWSSRTIADRLRRDIAKVFPTLAGVKIDYAWSGLMSYARHQMVQITQAQSGLWVLQGFGGHGVSSTTAMGEVLASALAINDLSWTEYSRYPLNYAGGPIGKLAAQLSYWGYQTRDALVR
jgi:gamma-glutamylputrescine oxidase